MINIRDYGAVGNGVINDSTAMLNAMAAAILAGGGSVYFPAGTYLVNSITVNSSLKLIGDGIGRTVLQQADTVSNFITVGTSAVTLQDLVIVANTSATSGNAVYIDSGINNVCLIRMRATAASQSGVLAGAVSNLQVQGCQFDTNGVYQFFYSMPAGQTASRILLADSIFDGSGTTTGFVSLFVETQNGSSGALTDFSIVGNLIYSKSRGSTESDGIVFGNNLSGAESLSRLVIADNIIAADMSSSTACYGIEIAGCTDVSISGNVIENYYNGLLLEPVISQPTLTNNGVITGNTILPNAATGASGCGISVSNGTWIIANNQIVKGGGSYGIYIAASNTVVVGNSIYAPNAGIGILVSANGVIINDNYITSGGTGGGSYGIMFANTTMSALQVRNNFINSLTYGFVFSNTVSNTDVAIAGTVFNSVSVKYHGTAPGVIILDDSNAGYFSVNVPTVLGGPYIVSALPAASATLQGARTFVTDATSPTYLGLLTGGGTVICGAFCNGSNWVAC